MQRFSVHKIKIFGTLLCTLTHYITVIYSYESHSENSKFRWMVVNNLDLHFYECFRILTKIIFGNFWLFFDSWNSWKMIFWKWIVHFANICSPSTYFEGCLAISVNFEATIKFNSSKRRKKHKKNSSAVKLEARVTVKLKKYIYLKKLVKSRVTVNVPLVSH